MKYLIILAVLSISTLFAKISSSQLQTLQIVRDTAREIPNSRGETYEDTLSAICLTESSGGVNIIGDFKKGTDITKASLGSMQIQVPTARYVSGKFSELEWVKHLSDAQLANALLTNVKLSATIAAFYLKHLNNIRKYYFSVVSGYNGGVSNRPYFDRVMKNIKLIKSLVTSGLLR